MIAYQILEFLFWYVPIAFLVILTIAIVARRLYQQIPYFCAYIAVVDLQGIGLWILGKQSPFYTPFYWSGNVVSWVLGIAVIWEIYAKLLKEYAVLRKVGRVLFWIVGAILVLVAMWTAHRAPGADAERVLRGALTLERSVRIVQCGLLLVLFVFSSFFGLSWKDQLFGIALGFAVYVCTELAVVAIRAYTGHTQIPFYRYLNPAAWDVALIIWTFYVVKQWRPATVPKLPKNDLAAWNDTLRDLLHR